MNGLIYSNIGDLTYARVKEVTVDLNGNEDKNGYETPNEFNAYQAGATSLKRVDPPYLFETKAGMLDTDYHKINYGKFNNVEAYKDADDKTDGIKINYNKELEDAAGNSALLKIVSNLKKHIIFVSLLSCFMGAVTIFQAFYLSGTINAIFEQPDKIIPYFICFLLTVLLHILLRYPMNILSVKSEAAIKSGIRNKLLDKIYRLGLTRLTEERSGKLCTLLLDRTEALAPYYSTYLPNLTTVFFVSMGCIIYIGSISLTSSLLVHALYDLRQLILDFKACYHSTKLSGFFRSKIFGKTSYKILDVCRVYTRTLSNVLRQASRLSHTSSVRKICTTHRLNHHRLRSLLIILLCLFGCKS